MVFKMVNLNSLCHVITFLTLVPTDYDKKKPNKLPPPPQQNPKPNTQTNKILFCITFRELDLIPQI